MGVYGDTSDDAPLVGNIIANNLIRDLPNNGQGGYYGEGVIIYDDFYAQITGNTISHVRTGMQTGNNHLSAGAFVPEISGNHVSATVKGIYFNLQYQSASSFIISGNVITQYDGSVQPAYNVGLLIQSIQGAVSSTITDNDVSGFLYGVEFAGNNTTQGNNTAVTLTGGTLDGNTYGVWATNNDYFYPANYDTTAALDGVSITNSTTAGIWVDSTSATRVQFNTTNTVTPIENDTSRAVLRFRVPRDRGLYCDSFDRRRHTVDGGTRCGRRHRHWHLDGQLRHRQPRARARAGDVHGRGLTFNGGTYQAVNGKFAAIVVNTR